MQVYAWVNVDLSCLGRMIYARQFLGAKPPIQPIPGAEMIVANGVVFQGQF